MAGTSLPPGFRFHPTDVELVMYYLKKKVMGKKLHFEAISDINIYNFSPWDLPDKSCLKSKDLEWYFFCPKEKKYASGAKRNRATDNGYWKSTGKDRAVLYNDKTVGMVKTLIFHKGHAPHGERTDWVIHEYRMEDKYLAEAGLQGSYVLCKVFEKSGRGPKNGAQYGAPFNEEEWDDDGETYFNFFPTNCLPKDALPNYPISSTVTSMSIPGSTCCGSLSEPGPPTVLPQSSDVPSNVPDDDEIAALLSMFRDDCPLLPIENNNNKESGFILDTSIPSDDSFLEMNDLESPLTFPVETIGSEQILTDSFCATDQYINLEEFMGGNGLPGIIQQFSCSSQSPLLAEQSDGHGAHLDVIQIQKNVTEVFSYDHNAISNPVNSSPCIEPEASSKAARKPKRGRFH